MPAKSAVIYARVSTTRQAADELPIESQVEACRKKAGELGAVVDRVFVDGGISGGTDQRMAFQDAITYCIESGVSYFVTWDYKRFAREYVDAGLYRRKLKKHGVEVIHCTSNVDTTTSSGYTFQAILDVFADAQRRQTSEDTRRSLLKNARDGHWNGGKVPFGFKRAPSPKNPKRFVLVHEPAEAWLVRCIFDWHAQGSGAGVICRRLNDAGHQHRGKVWHKSAVHGLLTNPAVAGITVFNRRDRYGSGGTRPESDWIKVESHQGIVPRDEWDRVQDALHGAGPGKVGGHPLSGFLFTGIAVCGKCGSNMVIETAKGRSERYSYYQCGGWISTGKCQQQRRRAEMLDEFLLQAITTRVFTRDTLREVAGQLNAEVGKRAQERAAEIRAIKADLVQLQRRKAGLLDILELNGREAPNLADIGDRLRDLGATIRAKNERIAQIEAQQDDRYSATDEFVDELRDTLIELVGDPTEVKRARAMLGRLVNRVVLHSESVEIDYHTQFLGEMNRKGIAVHSSIKWLPVQNGLGTAERGVAGVRTLAVALPAHLRRAA